MASWQYHHPNDRQPLAPTDKGYFVSFPYANHVEPSESRYNGLLEFNGNQLYLWIHDISMSFQIGGEGAQSHHYREFYARNLAQPSVKITGQTHSQEQYGEIAEFIRRGQSASLKPQDESGKGNTMVLTIPEGGNIVTGHKHQGHHFRGHIKNIQRATQRWVNAPEYSFEFIVVAAYQGVFSSYFTDPSATKEKLAMYMQIPNEGRKNVAWVVDPDSTYDKGARPG